MTIDSIQETWQVEKAAVEGESGAVASQHQQASTIGADVLREGGNAVDAAVAMGLAIGCVEPWMSGIGGGGNMLIYVAKEKKTYCVEFGMVAPRGLDPDTYPIQEGVVSDSFGWPGVLEDRNLHGPHSIAVPGHVAGMALALERFGSRTWQHSIAPAIVLARQGLLVDWYGTVIIASGAELLCRYTEAARTYLPRGLPPSVDLSGAPVRVQLGKLETTLRRLSEAGPGDFYDGELAHSIVADARAAGSTLSLEDMKQYRAQINAADRFRYRDATVHAASGLTAGPTLKHALALLEAASPSGSDPDAARYVAYAKALSQAYEHRLATMGDADEVRGQSCTTHLNVADKNGNLVALTQTLLSTFGSRVMLPDTGVLMNNGIMWFDPRQGRPNSIRPGRKPLSNMCPVIVERPLARERSGTLRFAVGASGGRRIMPAVLQIISSMVDDAGDLDACLRRPRIDCDGSDTLTVDARLSPAVQLALSSLFKIRVVQGGVYPPHFACPSLAGYREQPFRSFGATHIMSPWTKAEAA